MLTKKYDLFCHTVKRHAKAFKGKKISEEQFDSFIEKIITDSSLDVPDTIYCRDGFAFLREVDKFIFQIACFQINTFGEGVFKKEIAKFCTPILITVKVHGSSPYLNKNLQEVILSVEEFYLGKHFSGSKGSLCDRNLFNLTLRDYMYKNRDGVPFDKVVLSLLNINYVCHHIAETLGYGYGALNLYWKRKKNMVFLSSGSRFNEKNDKLHLDIVEDFSSEKMRSYFQVPHYKKLPMKTAKFDEEKDFLLLEVTCGNEIQPFYLPSGFQKVNRKIFHKNVQVVTTQHIIEHLLVDYYKRDNAFVVSNTFEVLEYLSRAMMAKRENRGSEEASSFIKEASACRGQYPESNLDELLKKGTEKYSAFSSEFAYNMFFRPPVLK